MKKNDIESLEIDLLLEALFQVYGYDFRSYARASVERRIKHFMQKQKVKKISELIPICLYDETAFSGMAQEFSVSVTEMFRDPYVYKAIREKVIPYLKSYPFIKIWHAGCATGEEVYSLAILLHEMKMLKKCSIFGTDFNDNSLAKAKTGIYPVERIKDATRNYQETGGVASLSEYYHARYNNVTLNQELRKHITFANHNLASDNVFGEMQLVMCRNVMIYFNKSLQERVLELFTESLVRGGFLILGTREDLRFSGVANCYELIDKNCRIYQKKR